MTTHKKKDSSDDIQDDKRYHVHLLKVVTYTGTRMPPEAEPYEMTGAVLKEIRAHAEEGSIGEISEVTDSLHAKID
jgi:hypothetical protein